MALEKKSGQGVWEHEAIVIGTSAGGLWALTAILRDLPETYPLPILVVQHRAKDSLDLFEEVLQQKCRMRVRQANEKEKIEPGVIYVAPPDYHLLIEADKTLSLSSETPVRYSRPSIDVLFESAAVVYRKKLVGIILTGSNDDGAAGIEAIYRMGGLTIAQDPRDAQYPYMTEAAIKTHGVREIWPLAQIEEFLKGLSVRKPFS